MGILRRVNGRTTAVRRRRHRFLEVEYLDLPFPPNLREVELGQLVRDFPDRAKQLIVQRLGSLLLELDEEELRESEGDDVR